MVLFGIRVLMRCGMWVLRVQGLKGFRKKILKDASVR